MGNRGVDLGALKAQRAADSAMADARAMAEWARALQSWLNEPLDEDQVDERVIKVALTGQTLIVSRRLAPAE